MATHHTKVATSQPVPTEIDAGAAIALKATVSCAEGCDLRGIPVHVRTGDHVLGTRELATHEAAINETEDFVLEAPASAGEHAWTIVFPGHESETVVHEESCRVVSFTTRPHATSMAVWDVPSPVVVNQPFRVKVGVTCAATCPLAGRLIDVCDEAGIQIGEGRLGDTPWPGTSALYVAELELAAPATEGIVPWSARFAAVEPGVPHEASSTPFSFRTARPPEHRVTVRLTDRETQVPLEDVEVRLGVYRASTDARGLARFELPGGVYSLGAWRVGYEALPRTVDVDTDLLLEVEATLAPATDPDSERVWM
jgi:hypothetical protein